MPVGCERSDRLMGEFLVGVSPRTTNSPSPQVATSTVGVVTTL